MTIDLHESDPVRLLGQARRGFSGTVQALIGGNAESSLSAAELECRLIELGFVEGARVEVLHEGLIGRDPMALRIDDMRVALRRREAQAILVELAR